jgi:8-oxo-dGTP pyrophosphatase MutT (NUDIX family)
MPWKTLSSRSVYKNRWMEVTEDVVESPTGKKLTFGVVRKEPFALIIPWDGEYFTLVSQYRSGPASFTLEFPQGHFEHSSMEATARAELEEETGLTAGSIEEIGSFCLAPGHHTQVCRVFLAQKLSVGKAHPEETEEGMTSRRITPKQFKEMVISGEIVDGPSIAALGILSFSGKLPG